MLVWTILSLFGQYTLADHVLYARFPNTSSITTSSLSSSTSLSSSSYTGTCTPLCQAVQASTGFRWVKQAVTTSILAAKVILIFNKATNTTRTVTSYYPLPAGHTLPPTDKAGAHITTISVLTAAGQPKKEVVLAYPTELNVDNPEYSWQGTLPTIGPMGAPICSTVNSPNYATVTYKATLTPKFVQNSADKEDPFGYIYSLDSPVCFGSADATINPNDAAPKLCQFNGVCGIHAESTALYLTETSSSVEDVPAPVNKQTPTPTPNTPLVNDAPQPTPAPNTPAPAQAQNTPTPAQPAQQDTSPAVAANIGAILNPGSQPTPAQAGSAPSSVPQPTVGDGVPTQPSAIVANPLGTQPAASPGAQSPDSPSLAPATVIVVGSSSYVANSDSVYVIAGQSLSAGGVVVVGGTSIALASAGQVAVVGGVTQHVQTVPVAQNTPAAPVLNIGGQAITANSNSAFVVAGQTITPGSAIVVAGTTISLLPSGAGVVVNGATQIFQTGGAPPAPSPALTVNGQTYSANSQSAFVIAGQTLSAGKTIAVSGTTIALASTGGVAVINGVTQTIAPSGVPAILTINGQTITGNPKSSYIISGQTLAPDHPITIGTGSSATTLILAADSAGHPIIVVNGKTSTIASGAPHTGAGNSTTTAKTSSTTTNGVGDYIASGIGFSSVGTSQFTGSSTSTTAGASKFGFEMRAFVVSSVLGLFVASFWI